MRELTAPGLAPDSIDDRACFHFLGILHMLNHAEHEFTSFLAAWPASEDRIIHLYELDPTHVAAESSVRGLRTTTERKSANVSRSPLPFCLIGEYAPAAVLLELDPTH